MPKYVIHVGPPKTGSKYIQSILFHSRNLMSREGICYPENWWSSPDQIMHEPLLNALRVPGTPGVSEEIRRINSAGHRVVVLSCEGFVDLEEYQLESLRDAIGNNPIAIVYYCRRWSERIPSEWQQHVKMGMFPTLPEFYINYMKSPSAISSINYSLTWDKLCRVFGRESLNIISYNNLKQHRIDIFRHFAATFLDWSRVNYVDNGLIQSNVSPNVFDTEILRVLNWLDFSIVKRYRRNTRVKFEILRSKWETKSLESAMKDEVFPLEICDDAEAFEPSWKSMAMYADRIVSRELGDQLFKRNTVGFNCVHTNYMLKDGVLDTIKSLFKDMQECKLDHPEIT